MRPLDLLWDNRVMPGSLGRMTARGPLMTRISARGLAALLAITACSGSPSARGPAPADGANDTPLGGSGGGRSGTGGSVRRWPGRVENVADPPREGGDREGLRQQLNLRSAHAVSGDDVVGIA